MEGLFQLDLALIGASCPSVAALVASDSGCKIFVKLPLKLRSQPFQSLEKLGW